MNSFFASTDAAVVLRRGIATHRFGKVKLVAGMQRYGIEKSCKAEA